MVTILLDSSNTNLSVGIARDNLLLESISYEAWQQQSEYMIPELNKLLEKYGVKMDEIKEVIVAKGPGSYTGVRIAITIAKTIATALDAKLYAVSSLRVQKDRKSPSICLINARSGRSYIGVYEGEKTLLADQIWREDVSYDEGRGGLAALPCRELREHWAHHSRIGCHLRRVQRCAPCYRGNYKILHAQQPQAA